MSAPLVIGVMSVGPIVAVLVLVIAVVRADTTPVAMVIFYLSILVLGPIAYFVASFGPGMALADTYGIAGNDHSPWARPLYVVSGVALLTIISIAAASWRVAAPISQYQFDLAEGSSNSTTCRGHSAAAPTQCRARS